MTIGGGRIAPLAWFTRRGAPSKQTYRERLCLRHDDDIWYVDLREPLSTTDTRPLPPASTFPRRAGSCRREQ
jgi:hypothetical protein